MFYLKIYIYLKIWNSINQDYLNGLFFFTYTLFFN